jgi:hypothetical protein
VSYGHKAHGRQSKSQERGDCRKRKKAPVVEENPRQGTESGDCNPDRNWFPEMMPRLKKALRTGDDGPRRSGVIEDGTERVEAVTREDVYEWVEQGEKMQGRIAAPTKSANQGGN